MNIIVKLGVLWEVSSIVTSTNEERNKNILSMLHCNGLHFIELFQVIPKAMLRHIKQSISD